MNKKYTLIALVIFLFSLTNSKAQFWQANKIDYTRSVQAWKMRPVGDNVVWNYGFTMDETSNWTEDNYSVQKSIDGGRTWSSYDFPNCDSAGYLSDVFGLNANVAYISFVDYANGNFLYKTTDGGNSWTDLAVPISTFINFSYFYDEMNGIAVGDPDADYYFEIFLTQDGGVSWTQVSSSDIPIAADDEYGNFGDYAVSGNHIWFSTTNGKVYHSSDKGLTWEVFESLMDIEEFAWGVTASDDGTCYLIYAGLIENTHRMFSRGPSDKEWLNITPADNNRFVSGLSALPGSDILLANSFANFDDDSTFTTHLSFDKGISWKLVGAGQRAGYTTFTSNQVGYACEIPFSYERPSEVVYRYASNPITLINTVDKNAEVKMDYNNQTKALSINWSNYTRLNVVLIVDASGKLIHQYDLKSNTNYSQVISLTSLVSSNYFAIVGDDKNWLNSKTLMVH